MDMYPAIDLRRGAVVRLSRGAMDQETQYSTDPASTASVWFEQGSRWLHVVNLDGAFGDETSDAPNVDAIRTIIRARTSPLNRIQLGGGIRTIHDVRAWLNAGVYRVVLGSAAIRTPALVREAIAEFGAPHIAVGIDALGGAVDGRVRIQGWTQESDVSPVDLAKRVARDGVRTIIYTDIDRDGMQTGPDVLGAKTIAMESGCDVIISGGVGTLEHVRTCATVAAGHRSEGGRGGLVGVITGRAIYEGNFTVREANDVVRAPFA